MGKLLTPKELSDRWHICEGTLANWRSQDFGPLFLRIGGRVLYREEDIISFEEESRSEE